MADPMDPLGGALAGAPKTPLPPGSWHPRTECPPRTATNLLWASDGEYVWLVYNDGTPIPDGALLVLWWTTALIPAPPRIEGGT